MNKAVPRLIATITLASGLVACSSSGGATCDATCQSNIAAANGAQPPTLVQTQGAVTGVPAWYRVVQPDFDAVSTAQGAISTAATNSDTAGVAAGCQQLKDAVVTFEADPAAPDATLRVDLAHAMDAYSTAATECLSGDLASAATDMETGTAWIGRGTARINALSAGG